jgi:hypothetical protein
MSKILKALAIVALVGAGFVPLAGQAHAAAPTTCGRNPCPWPITPATYSTEMAAQARSLAEMKAGTFTVPDQTAMNNAANTINDATGEGLASTAKPMTVTLSTDASSAATPADDVVCSGPYVIDDTFWDLPINDFELAAENTPTVPADDPDVPPGTIIALLNWVVCFDNTTGLWGSQWQTGIVGSYGRWVGPEYKTGGGTSGYSGYVLNYAYNPAQCGEYENYCPVVSGSKSSLGPYEEELYHCYGSGTTWVQLREAMAPEFWFGQVQNPLWPGLSGKFYMAAGASFVTGIYALGHECGA